MKIYSGDAYGNVIVTEDGGEPRELKAQVGEFRWGTPPSIGGQQLAFALMFDMTGDETRTWKTYQRLKWRTVATWPAGAPWRASEAELMAVIDDIEKVAKDTAGMRQQMARELPKVQGAAGGSEMMIDRAPPGAEWSKNPELIPNVTKKEK